VQARATEAGGPANGCTLHPHRCTTRHLRTAPRHAAAAPCAGSPPSPHRGSSQCSNGALLRAPTATRSPPAAATPGPAVFHRSRHTAQSQSCSIASDLCLGTPIPAALLDTELPRPADGGAPARGRSGPLCKACPAPPARLPRAAPRPVYLESGPSGRSRALLLPLLLPLRDLVAPQQRLLLGRRCMSPTGASSCGAPEMPAPPWGRVRGLVDAGGGPTASPARRAGG